ncbi:uncharacterized protein Z518_09935 [Rhinocladiella mackenziei CBS 650.93]|uniref:Major facilitator superfamily (MFS) profile domain-containing protein n=1 Tax=Rhinocladiella mackenziei CBS 650.93 TaxID=1442369 RepID=A0A0D2IW03_9EURO|nr:uncharacterized protein Z518_09935 [Rhinocladiella mackenziei CBS 650.93]KIX00870.1 hypothetical protein Z518_09935 [Rhinocladiella mackenziei CBS 650.93]
MNGSHTDNQRWSQQSDQQHQQPHRRRTVSHEDLDDVPERLFLSRTRSQEFSIVESIAVQEVPPDDSRSVSASEDGGDEGDGATTTIWPRRVRYLVLLCAFLTSLSFGVTQVPLVYVFRLMTCDAYYEEHPSQGPNLTSSSSPTPLPARAQAGAINLLYALTQDTVFSTNPQIIPSERDRCSIHAIETSTALSVSLLGASTTVFGLLNLFLTGALIKRIGVKPTLLIQVFFPALRLLVQNVGVEVWSNAGIIIIQCSQIVSIIGGPSGYLLVLNAFITEVMEHEGRTAALGRLTGAMMFGSALGFLLGGAVAEAFGIKAPFRLTLILFLSACVYVAVFLPHIPPAQVKTDDEGSMSESNKKNKTKMVIGNFFGPLAVFAPRKFIAGNGAVSTEYGAHLLAWGVFLGILATGYLPTLLQLYSTDVFGFGTKENGWLIFMYSMLRGVFLTFAFPKLISLGRKWTIKKEKASTSGAGGEAGDSASSERQPLLPPQTHQATRAENADAYANDNTDKDRAKDNNQGRPQLKNETFTFDLTYTRVSLVADGLLTLLCSFIHEGNQMYLVAAILPFAAGTGSASKGTILQMVGSSASSDERTDALAGVSLVENMARLSTTFVFGVIFAAFASIGRPELVFTCNAAVALIGFGVLLFARFPPEGSIPFDKAKDVSRTGQLLAWDLNSQAQRRQELGM